MWATGLGYHTRYETLGESSGDGTTITAGNGSKSAYVTLGTPGFDYAGLWLDLVLVNSGSFRIDVATGSADTIIAPDLMIDTRNSGGGATRAAIWLPLGVPSGSAIKVAAQTTAGSQTIRAVVQGCGSDARGPLAAGRMVCLNGWSAATPVNTVTQDGTAGVNTAWVELTSSAPADLAAIYLAGSSVGDVTRTAARQIIDIATGAAASEQVRLSVMMPNGANGGMGLIAGPYGLRIPAGTRIAWRTRRSVTAAGDSYGIAGWGLVA